MNWIVMGALTAFVGVALGAFGSHSLQRRVGQVRLPSWETAVRYHMYHALAIIITGLVIGWRGTAAPSLLGLVPWLFAAGTVLFSGSLYLLVLTGKRWLGAVTPLGGLLLLGGWLGLAAAAWQS